MHDGDTLFLADGTKVRLLGIDTPEVGDDLECYGDEATALLRSLLPEGAAVSVLADQQPLDQYGRALLFIYTDDGDLVNLTLIEKGAAEAVVLPPNLLFADELEAAEDAARSAARRHVGSLLAEGRDARDRLTEHERVHLVGALVGAHRLQVAACRIGECSSVMPLPPSIARASRAIWMATRVLLSLPTEIWWGCSCRRPSIAPGGVRAASRSRSRAPCRRASPA